MTDDDFTSTACCPLRYGCMDRNRAMPIVPLSPHSLSSTPMTWLAATASITLASCSVEGRRVPLQRMWRWDARTRLVQGECGCSRRRTAET